MKSIFKYPLKDNLTVIEGPIRKILSAQVQHGEIVVWAEVDDTCPNKKIEIIPVGTGWNLDEKRPGECLFNTHQYLDTVQLSGGALVFHIYIRELLPVVRKRSDNKANESNYIPNKNSKISSNLVSEFT